MRIAPISDLHGMYSVNIPPCDTVVFTGDTFGRGVTPEVIDPFIDYASNFNIKNKVIIAGNHDAVLKFYNKEAREKLAKAGFVYLEDSGVTIDGVSFYGMPWSPIFMHWYFMLNSKQLRAKCASIPYTVDVLLTHSPAYGILDKSDGRSVGCRCLKEAIDVRDIKYHIHGHIHCCVGVKKLPEYTAVNAAVVTNSLEVRPTPVPVLEV